jgi:hypothetical protein
MLFMNTLAMEYLGYMDVLERAIPTWPDSLCQQLQAGLRLRPEDIAKGNTRPPIN